MMLYLAILAIFQSGPKYYQPPMYSPVCYAGSVTCRALPGPVTTPVRRVGRR